MRTPDIHSLQAGDEATWDAAFHSLWPVAWTAAQRRLNPHFSRNDIEDIAISAIREAAEKVSDVSSFPELTALTGVIADRRAVDHLRRAQAARRSAAATESLEGHEDVPALGRSPLEELTHADLARLLSALAASLPDHQQDLLFGYYIEGRTQAELARATGMPIGTVGVTLSRAVKALRAELIRRPKLLKEFMEVSR